ncbi:MAG TPA: UPF0280 family protein [Archaeoglobus profundus]|nr:UPF0280 family protein [Archaeoglobus profundus]
MKKYKKYKFRYKETIVTILAEDDKFYEIAVNAILEARKKIELYIKRDPFFYVTLEPYDCKGEIVERMCKASNLAGVGPMATVAGVIAQYAVEKMVDAGARFAVIENGGDIAMYIDRPIVVGLYTYSLTLGLKIEKTGYYAVCTSSGTIGHSISFGFADAATIFARDACIADAFATALGNIIKDDFKKEDIMKALKNFWEKSKNYIEGALVVKDNIVGFVGDVPKFVNAKVNVDIKVNY